MSYHIEKFKTNEEWKESRKFGFGSSEVPTLLGMSHFGSLYQIYCRKKGLPYKEPDMSLQENEKLILGHLLEPVTAQRFADKTGAYIVKQSEGDWLAINDEKPYLRVSPDRLYWRKGDAHTQENLRILELKSANRYIDVDNYDDYWFIQVQYQMGVMGIKHATVCWLAFMPNAHTDYAEVDFDQDVYDIIVNKIEEFREKYLIPGIPPPAQNSEDIKWKWSRSTKKKFIVAPKEIQKQWREYVTVYRDWKKYEKMVEEAKIRLQDFMGDNEVMYDENKFKIASHTETKESLVFDEKRFAEENSELYKKYLVSKPASFRWNISTKLPEEKPAAEKPKKIKKKKETAEEAA